MTDTLNVIAQTMRAVGEALAAESIPDEIRDRILNRVIWGNPDGIKAVEWEHKVVNERVALSRPKRTGESSVQRLLRESKESEGLPCCGHVEGLHRNGLCYAFECEGPDAAPPDSPILNPDALKS